MKPHYWDEVPRSSRGTRQDKADEAVRRLRAMLKDGERAATYGVVPDFEQSWHDVHEVSGTKMRFGGSEGGLDASERVERQPIEALGGIGGIFNWQSQASAAHFGWLVYPKPDNRRTPSPQPIYLPLSALVSLPSWWRQATLEVTSCWRSRATAASVSADCAAVPPEKLHIDLPGSPAELSRPLKFDIVNFPFVTSA